MTRVLAARLAKFLRFQTVGMFLPILGSRVIPVFAIVALQRYDFAHRPILWFHPNRFYFGSRQINCENKFPSDQKNMILIFSFHSNPKPQLIRLLNEEKYQWRIG
jgi:hypothetical protein